MAVATMMASKVRRPSDLAYRLKKSYANSDLCAKIRMSPKRPNEAIDSGVVLVSSPRRSTPAR